MCLEGKNIAYQQKYPNQLTNTILIPLKGKVSDKEVR